MLLLLLQEAAEREEPGGQHQRPGEQLERGAGGQEEGQLPGGVSCHVMTIMCCHVIFSCHVMVQVIRESRKHRDSHNTTLMLVIVIGLFLMTEIPLLVITVLHTLDNRCTILALSLFVCILVSQQYSPSLKILQVSSVTPNARLDFYFSQGAPSISAPKDNFLGQKFFM